MKTVEIRVTWSEKHHKDVLIEVPDDFDGYIEEGIEDDAIETAKDENRLRPHDLCEDSHNYRVEVVRGLKARTMETKKYEVTWKEDHCAEVEAENKTKAFEAAAHYAQEHDTCVDEDEYKCRLAGESDEVERSAAVIRDALNMRRVVTISVDGGTATIEDRLIHPVESCSRIYGCWMI